MNETNGEEFLRAAIRRGRGIFASAVAFSFLCNILRLTGPLFILLVYDRVLTSGSEETLVVLFSLVVAFLITMGMVDYARQRLLARFGAQFQEKIEEQIFNTTRKEEFFRTTQVKPAAALSDLDNIRGFFHSKAIIALLDVFSTPMFLAVIFIFHWILGWVVVGGLALLAALHLVKSYMSAGRRQRAEIASKDVGNLKNMIVTSRSVLKTQSMTASFNEHWLRARRTSRDSSIARKDWGAWFTITARQIKLLLQYSVLATGAYLVINGYTTIGAMITSMFLSTRVFVPIEQFLNYLPEISKARQSWQFLKKSFASRAVVTEQQELWDIEPGLVVKNLSRKSSLTGLPILRAINLTVDAGQLVHVTGASGAGKTVLAETIVGASQKSAGSIACGGVNLDRFSVRQAARLIALVPETARFVSGTIAENIAGLEPDAELESIVAAARAAGIHETVLGLPQGYQTALDNDLEGLSKGARSQLALARALYKRPRVLIVDDPDPVVLEALAANIDDIRAQTGAAILVLSRESMPSLKADREYVLADGKLKAKKAVKNVVPIETRRG